MRRRAVLERAVQCWEFCFHNGLVVAGNIEGFDHQLGTVVTNRARRELGAVADDVVLVSQNLERIFVEQVVHSALRHRERVVGEFHFAVIVELVHREVDDPAEAEDVFFEQVELLREFGEHMPTDALSPL